MARRLAVIERIEATEPIPGADAIELATVRGWQVVVRKGELGVGDRCVYFEVDSLLPETDERFASLMDRGVRTDANGVRGHVVRTAQLRGVVSQGLALPLGTFPELGPVGDERVGEDVTAALGVVAFEAPIAPGTGGESIDHRPLWTPATDAERVQNVGQLLTASADLDWVATEKLDGLSATFTYDPDDEVAPFGVSGLHWRYAVGDTLPWRVARSHDLEAVLGGLVAQRGWRRAAVQGEVVGARVRGNPLGLSDVRYYIFGVIVDEGAGSVMLPRAEWPAVLAARSVPVLDLPLPATVADALAQAERLSSALNPEVPAEGIVWRLADTRTQRRIDVAGLGEVEATWKVLSRRYLLLHEA